MTSLTGKAVLVTGAGRGLGRAYALAIAEAGASVAVNDVDAVAALAVVDEISALGGNAIATIGSVADPATAERAVADCELAFGRIDGMVANAGVLSPGALVDETPEVIAETIAVNVVGVALGVAAAARRMRVAGRGSIVTVVSGSMQGLEHLALYGASKSAVLGLTVGLALELEGSGVRINAVSPLARTAMSDLMPIPAEAKGLDPALIAPAVLYLLGERSRQLNGQVVRFDGRRLGIVAAPRLAATTDAHEPWTAELVADAVDGPLAPFLQPVGLVAAAPPVVVGPPA